MVARIAPKNAKLARLFLREWREHKGLSQEALAERMETTKSTISRMESATREPNLGYLVACAEQLQCRPEDLFRSPVQPVAVNGFAESEQAAFSPPPRDDHQLRRDLEKAMQLLESVRQRL